MQKTAKSLKRESSGGSKVPERWHQETKRQEEKKRERRTISRDYQRVVAHLLQSYWPHRASRTGGYFKPIRVVYDSFCWLFCLKCCWKRLSLSPPHYKRHSFEVRMKTSVSPESSTLHTNGSPITMTHTFKMSTNWHTYTNGVFSVARRDALQQLVSRLSIYTDEGETPRAESKNTWRQINSFKPTCGFTYVAS